MSLAVLARKTRAKQKLRKRGKFILNMTGRGNVLGMNAKMSRGNCKGLTTCAGKRAACCVGVGPQDNCNRILVPTTQPDLILGAAYNNPEGTYGYDGEWDTGTLPSPNILNINTTDSTLTNRGALYFDADIGTNGGLVYDVGVAGGPLATFNTLTFVAQNGTSVSYSYNSADSVTLQVIQWNNSPAQYSWWLAFNSNPASIQIFLNNTNPNTGSPYFKDPCCCRFPHGGQPAPQMGYRVYLNRKSKGAYRPAGGKQCKTLSGCTSAKSVWKQGSNLDAGEITRKRRDNILACNSDVYTAKKDTCTGCINCEDGDNTLTVGYATGTTFGEFWGYDNPVGSTTGNLVPDTIHGSDPSGVRYLGFQTAGNFQNQFYITFINSGYLQNFFNSITFANCKDKSLRTYNTSDASFNTADTAGGLGGSTWRWNAAASGYSSSNEAAFWSGVSGENLSVFINNPNPFCCCPVKKSICGCRSTDVLRYTRINKFFGCTTTKAVRMGRTASEQIARRRAAVDCIAPKHRTIYLTIDATNIISFDGCCGNQCLIQGQQYTFQIKNNSSSNTTFRILWCQQVPGTSIGIFNDVNISQNSIVNASFTVPKFNNKSPCNTPDKALLGILNPGNSSVTLDYCKKAFKTPQMLGSCSGR